MQAILSVTVPFFALILCGYAAASRRILPEAAIPGLNAFVLYFALPCMLFRFGMRTPVRELFDPVLIGVYLLCALLVVAFTIRVTLTRHVHLKDAAFGALVAAFPNTGFMGVPLLVAMLGDSAAPPVILSILVDVFVTSSLCIALAQAHDASGAGPRAALFGALRGAASNPMAWAVAVGALSSATGYVPLQPVDAVIGMLANAASPVALFTIGAVLWRANQHAHTRTPVQRFLPVAGIKLLLHPLLIYGAGRVAQALGAPLEDFPLMVLTLAAALPSGSSVSMLAERFGADNGRIARIILSSTALAFITFSALAWVFGVQPKL